MSGYYDYEIRRQRKQRQAYFEEKKRLNKISKNLSKMLKDIADSDTEKTQSIIDDFNKASQNAEDILTSLKKEDEERLSRFKDEKINLILKMKEVSKQYEDIDIDFSDIIDFIKKTDDTLKIIKRVAKIKVLYEDKLQELKEKQEKENELNELFDLKTEEDFEDDSKVALFDLYKEFLDMGYNPVYDPNGKRIIVERDNGNQIVGEKTDDNKIRVDFLSYEGKSCSKDMLKVEKSLRKNGSIADDERIYAHWYNKKEQEEYESSEVRLKNKNIYNSLSKNQHSLYNSKKN